MTLSCGLLMYLKAPLRVLLVHPGGPYWRGKDKGVWSIRKGLPEPGETRLEAAQREFEEETGIAPRGPFLDLGALKQKRRQACSLLGLRRPRWLGDRAGDVAI